MQNGPPPLMLQSIGTIIVEFSRLEELLLTTTAILVDPDWNNQVSHTLLAGQDFSWLMTALRTVVETRLRDEHSKLLAHEADVIQEELAKLITVLDAARLGRNDVIHVHWHGTNYFDPANFDEIGSTRYRGMRRGKPATVDFEKWTIPKLELVVSRIKEARETLENFATVAAALFAPHHTAAGNE